MSPSPHPKSAIRNHLMLRFIQLVGLALFVFGPGTAGTQGLKPPLSAAMERGSTTASLKGGPVRWKNEWTMSRETLEGQPIVRFTENGSGRYSSFDQEVRWNIETIWSAGEWFRPFSTERTVTDVSGRLLLKERKSFHFDKGSVDIEREDPANATKSRRSLKIPSDTLAADGIAGALRSLPFERSGPVQLPLLSNEPRLYEISFEMRGQERVRVPAGEFECYKVELVPGLGVLNLFRFAIPKAYFWFTVAPPHYWVRYEGFENGWGTPQVVLELVTFSREGF